MKKILLSILIAMSLIGGVWLLVREPSSSSDISSQSPVKEITFYYLPTCPWCQKVEQEGTLEKIEQLGIKVNKINASIGPIRHKFEGVPTFVINEKVYSGYRTFEEIKELLGYPKENTPIGNSAADNSIPAVASQRQIEFIGEKGTKVNLENGEVRLEASIFNDNKARFYNIAMPNGKIIYFFVVKDKNEVFRAAANACQVCFTTGKGFHQEGNEIVCNNCGNRYPIEKIATEKGGCNPGPINPNLKVSNGQVIITQADLEQVSDLF